MFENVLKHVSIGTVAMLLPMFLVGYAYKVKLWKTIPLAVFSAAFGMLSTFFWYYVEGGRFGEGVSFYGGVFLMPLAFVVAPYIFREKYTVLLDMFAPAICIMLAVMKVPCYLTGCCPGRELFVNAEGVVVRFPSQLAELINGLVLMTVLLIMAFRKKERGTLYPWFMVLYGITRFILNFFRAEYAEHTGILPPYGTIWSVVSIIIGAVWLYLLSKKRAKQTESE